jgi:hypothetical protein
MSQRTPHSLKYCRPPNPLAKWAVFAAIATALAVEAVAAFVLLSLGLGWPFLMLAAAMTVVGAMIGWFSFRRLGLTSACCLLVSVGALIFINAVCGDEPISLSLGSVFEMAAYWMMPFVLAFLVPALVGGLVTALIRRQMVGSA